MTADHTYKPVRPAYQNVLGDYRIPILFFHPKIAQWPQVDTEEPTQQIDLLPSILDFLGQTPKEENLMGRSVFRQGPRQVVLFSDGLYWMVTRDFFATMKNDGDTHVERVELPYAVARDAARRPRDLTDAVREDLRLRLLATRQYFSEGLWDNALYFPVGR